MGHIDILSVFMYLVSTIRFVWFKEETTFGYQK